MKSKTSTKTQVEPAERRVFSHEEIAARAYLIWLEHGSEHGADEQDWLQAEEELRKTASN